MTKKKRKERGKKGEWLGDIIKIENISKDITNKLAEEWKLIKYFTKEILTKWCATIWLNFSKFYYIVLIR